MIYILPFLLCGMFAFIVFIQDSWVFAFKGRFKNLRRGIPTTKRQLENDDGAVPNKAKRQKLYIRLDNAPTHDATVVDDEAYQRHMKKLEQELEKTKKA